MSIDNLHPREFTELLSACSELARGFPEGIVFIGGIAVYLYTINNRATAALGEFTHDADFYISIADMADLRDIEELSPNRRLHKHQLIKRGFEFDIYTERYSSLIVPYDQVVAYAKTFEELKVASIEHLLVLKLEAFKDRRSSSKGQKDAKDIIRIVLVSGSLKTKLRAELINGYLTEDHYDLLRTIAKGPEFLSLAKGNAQEAKKFRTLFSGQLSHLIGGK